MKSYQLVLQYKVSPGDLTGINDLFELEELLSKVVKAPAQVDGHDVGSGAANIFIVTPDPQETFEAIRPILFRYSAEFKAAHRDFDEDEYSVLWPLNLRKFSLV